MATTNTATVATGIPTVTASEGELPFADSNVYKYNVYYYRVYANRTHDPVTTRKFQIPGILCIIIERKPLPVIIFL